MIFNYTFVAILVFNINRILPDWFMGIWVLLYENVCIE